MIFIAYCLAPVSPMWPVEVDDGAAVSFEKRLLLMQAIKSKDTVACLSWNIVENAENIAKQYMPNIRSQEEENHTKHLIISQSLQCEERPNACCRSCALPTKCPPGWAYQHSTKRLSPRWTEWRPWSYRRDRDAPENPTMTMHTLRHVSHVSMIAKQI